MSASLVENILKKIGHPALLSLLCERLSGSELNSLLLEVFRARAKKLTPASLLNHYQRNRFVKPADLPVLSTGFGFEFMFRILNGGL